MDANHEDGNDDEDGNGDDFQVLWRKTFSWIYQEEGGCKGYL